MRAIVAIMAATLLAADDWSEFQKLAKDRDPDQRCKAVELIRIHRSLQMVQALLPLLADQHPRVAERAVRAIGETNDPAAVEFLTKKALRHGDARVRRLTCEALAAIKDESVVEPLIGALADHDPDVRAQAADSLASRGVAKAVGALLAAFEKDEAWQARAWMLDAAVRLDPQRAAGAVEKAIADKAYQVRLEALIAAPKVSPEAGLAAFKALVGDPDWRVRVQAIETALALRRPECVGGVIGLFAKEKGRLRLDAFLALQDLTGKDLGFNPKAWEAWWEANRDRWTPPAPGQPVDRSAGWEGTRAEVLFFNMPIYSNRIAFVLDLSGSMRDEAPGGTKLDVAKRGMVKTINALGPDVRFNIILLGCERDGTYRREQRIWQKGLAPANPVAKAEAAKFIDRQEARGWTNIWDGLEFAFEDVTVDTVFLYSDGGASKGAWTASGELLAHLDRMNRFRKIMVCTVETPALQKNQPENVRLLKQIAAHTRGQYKLAETK